jgi:hypothetical protein
LLVRRVLVAVDRHADQREERFHIERAAGTYDSARGVNTIRFRLFGPRSSRPVNLEPPDAGLPVAGRGGV